MEEENEAEAEIIFLLCAALPFYKLTHQKRSATIKTRIKLGKMKLPHKKGSQ